MKLFSFNSLNLNKLAKNLYIKFIIYYLVLIYNLLNSYYIRSKKII